MDNAAVVAGVFGGLDGLVGVTRKREVFAHERCLYELGEPGYGTVFCRLLGNSVLRVALRNLVWRSVVHKYKDKPQDIFVYTELRGGKQDALSTKRSS